MYSQQATSSLPILYVGRLVRVDATLFLLYPLYQHNLWNKQRLLFLYLYICGSFKLSLTGHGFLVQNSITPSLYTKKLGLTFSSAKESYGKSFSLAKCSFITPFFMLISTLERKTQFPASLAA